MAAIQNDSGLDFSNQVALFTSDSDSYIYYSGASIGNSDDQIVKLSNLIGTRLNLDTTQKTVTVSTNLLVHVPLVHQGRTANQFRSSNTFAAIKMDGSVITWGDSNSGVDSTVASELNGDIYVKQLYSNNNSFAALRGDGSVITWGDSSFGGDSSTVASELNGDIDVIQVYSNGYAFAALKADGSVITWGNSYLGGDSSTVASEFEQSIKQNHSNEVCKTTLKYAIKL